MRHLSDARDERPRTALLLAAGMGSRLAPLTDSTAKCLVGLSGVSILERLVRTLSSYGFTRLVVVVGHESDAIQDYLGDHCGDIRIDYVTSNCYKTTNNIYRIKNSCLAMFSAEAKALQQDWGQPQELPS